MYSNVWPEERMIDGLLNSIAFGSIFLINEPATCATDAVPNAPRITNN